ncbi:MAG: T9SS type A sorting domain-containing protein [Bacteroidia bacterium]|nr:T9SS type A sorting domain-containing protein [Bacteroidia bacterium]
MKYVILIFASFLAAVSVYSQAPNTWTQKAHFGGTARWGAVGFSMGSKGYLGTGFSNDVATEYKDFWEYDPALNTWTQKADFGGTARHSAVGFSIGSKGYLGTGSSNIYPYTFKDFWEYDPALNTWTQKAGFGGTARYLAVGFSIVGKGYLGTGFSYDGVTHYKDFWEYDPALNTWTQKTNFGGTARYGAVGFSIGSKGYLGTGFYFDGTSHYIKDFWEYDPALNTWFKKADFGGTARYLANGFSIGSKGYLGTGVDVTYPYSIEDFWEYDPALNTWTQKTDFGGGERSSSVGFSIGSKGYLGTGYSYDGTPHKYKNFWEYTPECTGLAVYADADSDGYGDAVNSFFAADCIVPEGYITTNSSDCDDANAAVNPSIAEVCGNAIDDDCNGQVDCCLIPAISSINNITSTSAQLNWQAVPDALNYKIRYKVKNTDTWLIIKSPTNTASIAGLTASTEYALQVKSVCNRQPSIVTDWSFKKFFTTAPLKMTDALSLETSLELYPNPSSGDAVVHLILLQSSPVSVKIFDVNGKEIKIVVNQALDAGDHFFSINTTLFSKGLYSVQMISESGIQNEKLIVQ